MSRLKKHSVLLQGHATSVTIEDPFWSGLKEIAKVQNISMNTLISAIDDQREGNLSSALRLFVLKYYKDQVSL